MTLTGGDLVARGLAAVGVEVAFGLHGGHLDSMLLACRRLGIRLVDVRHEAVAVNAADGYARSTGNLGVAFATAGSGFSNAVAGLGLAQIDRSPLLLLTSSPPMGDAESNTLQGSVDQVAVARPLVKFAQRIAAIEEIPRILALAVRTALTGPPGPVVVDIPIDVLFRSIPVEQVSGGGGAALPMPPYPAPEGVDAALTVLRSARRPAIIAGGAVRGPVPCAPLVELAEVTGIPVFHPGWIVGAMPPDHPLNGYGAARNLGALTAEGNGPDAVLLVGSRFGLYLGSRGGGVVPHSAAVVEIDLDGAEIGRLRPVDVGIVADAGQALRALVGAARAAAPWPDRGDWAALATSAQRREPPFAQAPLEVDGRMHPYHALRELLRSLDPESTLVVDGGELSHWALMSLHDARPRRGIGCGYLGHLGMTPGLAIGAGVAEPDRRVILLVGDGGAGFHPQEFDTMVRHGLPVVTVVVNNESWGMSLHGQEILYGPEAGVVSLLADTAYEKVAAGFGALGLRVDRVEDIAPAVRAALAHDGPSCINLAVARDVAHPITAAMLGVVGAGETVIPYYDNVPASSPGSGGATPGMGTEAPVVGGETPVVG
jgi:acetolactate synthase I/II/III large subunit